MSTTIQIARTPAPETTTGSRVGANARRREATRTAQRVEVRRAAAGRLSVVATRIGLAALVVLGIAGATWGMGRLALQRGWIGLREIQVTGFSSVPLEEVVAIADLRGGAPLTEIDLDGLRRRLVAHPWIARATVRRSFPHRVAIVIQERVPALALPDGRWVAPDGVVLHARGSRALPIVDGAGLEHGRLSAAAMPTALAMSAIAAEAPILLRRIQSTSIGADGSLSVKLEGFPPLLRVRPEDWKREFARANLLENELGTEAEAIAEIDLRHGSCAALRRREGGA